jgi:ribosomal protein L9
VLDDPIRQLGEFKVQVKLHHEVSAEITVVVAKEA